MMKRRSGWLGASCWVAGMALACGDGQDEQRSSSDVSAGDESETPLPGRSLGDLDTAGSPGPASPAASATPALGEVSADGVEGGAPGSPLTAPPGPQPQPAGSLTAGAWDDNRNFARFLAYQRGLRDQQLAGLPEIDEAAQVAAAERSVQLGAHGTLDVALVIDTTASMDDELSYLQSEFRALSSAIEAQYPGAEQRWALVVYRDAGDEYLVRSFDFEATAEVFRSQLAAQSASGGGDYPEAPDAALEAMNQLGWRSDEATARLAFWVADAPHHIENTAATSAALRVAAEQDVHLYPVASSGVDELTEYSMRAAAQLTRGRYLFLTDDSGIGNSHKEPSIPCYFVTRLDTAILRMVEIEMNGAYREPKAADVIRASGDPADGTCTLPGETLFAF